MPKLTRLSQLTVKHETTMGTDIFAGTYTVANAVKVYELEFKAIAESTATERRPLTGAFGVGEIDVAGAYAGGFTAKTYLVGSGTLATAPAWGIFMPACGWGQDWTAATNVVYKPATVYSPAAWTSTSDHLGMGSISAYHTVADGAGGATAIVKKLKGCMGSCTLDLEMGKPGVWSWDFKGAHVTPTDDDTLATGTFGAEGAISACLNVGATWTPNGGAAHTPVLRKFQLKTETGPTLRPDMNDASGYISALITDRKITYSTEVEIPVDFDATAGADWWGHLKQTAAAFGVWEIGPVGTAGAGDRWAINLAKMGVGKVEEGDGDGIQTFSVSGACASAAPATGGDEVTITFD